MAGTRLLKRQTPHPLALPHIKTERRAQVTGPHFRDRWPKVWPCRDFRHMHGHNDKRHASARAQVTRVTRAQVTGLPPETLKNPVPRPPLGSVPSVLHAALPRRKVSDHPKGLPEPACKASCSESCWFTLWGLGLPKPTTTNNVGA